MMCKLALVVLAFGVVAGAYIRPSNVNAEIQAQLQDLNSLVIESIKEAHSYFSHYHADISGFRQNTILVGNIEIEEQAAYIDELVNRLQALANWGSVDISSCTNSREFALKEAPTKSKTILSNCVANQYQKAVSAIQSGKYVVDITATEIQRHQYDLNRCQNDVPCSLPVLQKVEEHKTVLPQRIQAQISQVEETLNYLNDGIKQCRHSAVNNYVSFSNELFNNIYTCVDTL